MKDIILEMERYAIANNVPIIEKDSIAFIMRYIKMNNVKNILEIGSAIGYSAILMSSTDPDIKVTTIEKDESCYMECLKNVKKCNFEEKIEVVYQDALDVNLSDVSYDLIFIDAAKGQYTKFFEKFKYFLKPNGSIISDNINFHGYASGEKEATTKGLKGIVTKLKSYREYLENNEEFTTKFIDIGDGLAISFRDNNGK